MPAREVYHYTDRLSCAEIVRDGLLRAYPIRLYRDLARQGEHLDTPPIVWLSSNPVIDTTVLAKLRAGGWPMPPVHDLCRVVLPYGYAGDLGLGEYTDSVGIPEDWWVQAVVTGDAAGSHYTTWRLVPHDIPAADWLRVETLDGIADDARTVWRPFGRPKKRR